MGGRKTFAPAEVACRSTATGTRAGRPRGRNMLRPYIR